MLGAGGTRIFELVGRELGQSQFRIAYARPWEYDNNWDQFEGTKYFYEINVVWVFSLLIILLKWWLRPSPNLPGSTLCMIGPNEVPCLLASKNLVFTQVRDSWIWRHHRAHRAQSRHHSYRNWAQEACSSKRSKYRVAASAQEAIGLPKYCHSISGPKS